MDRRTAKGRAQRIDLGYFKRPHPFRRWRLWLSIALPATAVLWIFASDVVGHQAVYDPGPLSRAHSVFSNRCELCHTRRLGVSRGHIADSACLTCHDGPKHQQNQVFTPGCSSCHAEHRGLAQVSEVSDASCTQCHASLRSSRGNPTVARTVTSFTGNHPEFRAKLVDFRDPGTIKLNHSVHLAAGLKGPHGPVQMQCSDCHRATANPGPWPYGMAAQAAAPPDVLSDRSHNSPYMAPMKYADQCAACHTLQFDRRFAEQVPHDKPDVIHKFLVDRYSQYIRAHPEAIRERAPQLRRIVEASPMLAPRNAVEWVDAQVDAAERLLWQKTCKECHTFAAPAQGTLPQMPKAAIPQRWMQRATFDHNAHTLVDCESCHTQTRRSKETSDILLPGIGTCRQCHQREQQIGSGAEARCFECHAYHDWSRQRRVKAPYTIPQIRGALSLPGTQPAALR